MNTLQKIIEEYEIIDSSSTWLCKEMEKAMIEFDKAENRCILDVSEEAYLDMELAVEKMRNLLARCNMEIKNCDKFKEKYNIK